MHLITWADGLLAEPSHVKPRKAIFAVMVASSPANRHFEPGLWVAHLHNIYERELNKPDLHQRRGRWDVLFDLFYFWRVH